MAKIEFSTREPVFNSSYLDWFKIDSFKTNYNRENPSAQPQEKLPIDGIVSIERSSSFLKSMSNFLSEKVNF